MLAEIDNPEIQELLQQQTGVKQTFNNNYNVYFKSLTYTNVLFKLEMNAQPNKVF